MSLRRSVIKIASTLPAGDPMRRKLLHALAPGKVANVPAYAHMKDFTSYFTRRVIPYIKEYVEEFGHEMDDGKHIVDQAVEVGRMLKGRTPLSRRLPKYLRDSFVPLIRRTPGLDDFAEDFEEAAYWLEDAAH